MLYPTWLLFIAILYLMLLAHGCNECRNSVLGNGELRPFASCYFLFLAPFPEQQQLDLLHSSLCLSEIDNNLC